MVMLTPQEDLPAETKTNIQAMASLMGDLCTEENEPYFPGCREDSALRAIVRGGKMTEDTRARLLRTVLRSDEPDDALEALWRDAK